MRHLLKKLIVPVFVIVGIVGYFTYVWAVNTHSIDLERGSSQYLSITDASSTALDLSGDFTIEAWVKIDNAPTSGQTFSIVSKDFFDNSSTRAYYFNLDDSGGTDRWLLQVSDGTSRFGILNSAHPTPGTWTHIAAVYDVDGDDVEFFKDASSIGTVSITAIASIQNTTADFRIGANGDAATNFFDGLIDEVRIWNDERTGTELSDNKDVELDGTEAGLVAYWKLNDDLLDEHTNNNDLTNNNSAVFLTDTPFGTTRGGVYMVQ